MKAPLSAWPRVASFLLLAAVLAGCGGDAPARGGDGDPPPPPADAAFSLNLTKADLADVGNARVLLRVVEGGELNATLALLRPEDPPDTWEGCGGVMVQQVREGRVIGGKGFSLSESRGRALIVPNDGDPVVLPGGGALAPESLALGGSLLDEASFRVEKGDQVLLDLSLREGASSLHEGYVHVTSNATLEVVEAATYRFVCGANVGNFSSGGFSAGVGGVAPTVVRDSRLEERAALGAEAVFVIVLDPRSKGACDIALLLGGMEANATGRRMDACAARAKGGPGTAAFVIREVVASGPVIFYAFWDRDDLTPRPASGGGDPASPSWTALSPGARS